LLVDRYGRPVTGLRITITHECNYKCFYCHMEGEGRSEELLTADDVARLVRVGKVLGIDKVKLTGGEPLLRHDIVDVVKAISGAGVTDLAMTTNGSLLRGCVAELVEAGLKRVNVSLPSLKKEVFEKITGVDVLDEVMEGLLKAKDFDIKPIKLNTVLLRGLNDREVWDLMEFAGRHDFILQVIELEPLGITNELYNKYHTPLDAIEKWLENRAVKVEERRDMQKRRQYDLGHVKVELVKAVNNPEFCMHCTRLRVTADGKLKPCLMRSDNLVDILGALKRGASDEELSRLFIEAVKAREPYFKGVCRAERARIC